MTIDPSILAAGLAPVADALRAVAHADAERLLAAVDAETSAAISAARTRAEAMVAEARAEGAADAAIALAGVRARDRRRARTVVQAARREAYQELRKAAAAAVGELRDAPDYPALRDGLAAAARQQLGPGATVAEHPSGGVIAEAAGRRVDYSLRGFADRAVERLGPDLEGLWAP